MYKKLGFRRQFLLSNETIDDLSSWQYRRIDDKHLYVHNDLELTFIEHGNRCIYLLGYIFDFENPEKTNEQILSKIAINTKDIDDVIFQLKPLAGRYALIFYTNKNLFIIHDPLNLREIYYTKETNKIICGSQPNLIDKYSQPTLGQTKNELVINFYKNKMKPIRSGRLWVGDETYYNQIYKLMPNHYLDIRNLKVTRYWPNKKIEPLSPTIAAKKTAKYLQGILRSVTNRYDVMMAVTAGNDSRSLLAASRNVKNKIYYFINKEGHLTYNSADIKIPIQIFENLNIPFNVHEVGTEVDENFKNIFLDNTFMSTELILPTIYNVYYKNHSNKMNLLGVGEIGRVYYGKTPHDIDGYYLARCLKYKNSKYATLQCQKWLNEAKPVSHKYNIDLMRMFLWEGLLSNWGVVGNSESDIAIEEFDPYNSHYIYEILLSIDPSKVDFFELILKELWPDLLNFPINPPENYYDKFKLIAEKLGLIDSLRRMIFKFDKFRYQYKLD